jgi:lambda repressor-like predicted transcriptional regulator
MDITTATAEAVSKAMVDAGESLSSLSEKAGLAYTTLQNKTKGTRPFTVKELGSIAEALDISVFDLIAVPAKDAA